MQRHPTEIALYAVHPTHQQYDGVSLALVVMNARALYV